MIETWALIFVATAAFAAMKSFQNLNIIHDNKLLVFPTSMLMAVAEVTVIATVAIHKELILCIPMGLGGTIGVWASMALHRRIRKENE